LTLGLLGTHASFLNATDLQWGRPAGTQVVQPSQPLITVEAVEQEFDVIDQVAPSDIAHDSAVMVAAWEEDDALAAELEDAPEDMATTQAGESRSVVTRRSANPLNTVDPFEADDRFAQLPNDPFDEPTVDTIPELNSNLDEVEDSLDREIERREAEAQEPSEEPEATTPVEEFEQEFSEPEAVEDAQVGEEDALESDRNFELRTPARHQPEVVRPYQQEQDARVAEELEQSQKSCEEEIAALRADHINSVDLNIRVDGIAGEDYPYECPLGQDELKPRVWPEITYTWKASALCHKPLYFEDVQLERYGHSWLPDVQPLVSGAHFFGSVAILPYKMGLETPNECIYALGHYRPGSCAPYYIEALPFTWRAAAFQAGVVTGINFALP
jgi:hypothetical protein